MLTRKIAVLLSGLFIIFSLISSDAFVFAQGQSGPSGKIVETMDSGGYTYVLLEKDDVKTWAAIPQTKVVVGETLTIKPGMVMPSFTSKTLNRTFSNIIFSGGAVK